MNKLTLLYDVVKTMKNKELVTGVLQAELAKDQVKIFSLQNEFEKNMASGQTKAKMTAELACEGQPSPQEHGGRFFSRSCSDGKHRHEFAHPGHHFGLKEKLARLAFALGLLDALKVEEQADKTIVISLRAGDLPDNMQQLLREKASHGGAHHHHRHIFLQEFAAAADLDVLLTIFVNKSYQVEKILVTANGTQTDPQAGQHALAAKAELSFVN